MPRDDDNVMDDYCPNCGQHTGGDSICPNCGAEIYDDSGLEEYDEGDEEISDDEEGGGGYKH